MRVGTVDKFQGQEAPVVFFSMATSSGEEIPRNVEFLFSRNRLNVAVSRAQCLAVLVAARELLHDPLPHRRADAAGQRALPAGRDGGGAGAVQVGPSMTKEIRGNKAIEDAAISWVMDLERRSGREPSDTRYRGAPADVTTLQTSAAITNVCSFCNLGSWPREDELAQRLGTRARTRLGRQLPRRLLIEAAARHRALIVLASVECPQELAEAAAR